MAAIATIDMALWDLKGKAAGMVVYQLIGGASGRDMTAYGHASGKDLRELFDSIRAHQQLGYRSIRVQTGAPGLRAIDGIASQDINQGEPGVRDDHEPARRGDLPVEEDWDTRAYLRLVPRVFDAVRNEFGPELPLLHDGHHRMTPIQAAAIGRSLEPCDIFWRKDWTPAENQRRSGLYASTPSPSWPSARSSTRVGISRC